MSSVESANVSLTKKCLWIYLAASFLLVWIPFSVYMLCGGKYESGAMQLILAYSMLCPAIAVIITRKVTKEGMTFSGEGSMMLGIHLSDKRWIWYLVAFITPVIYYELGDILYFLIFPETFDMSNVEKVGLSWVAVLSYPLYGIVTTMMLSFGGLGEEMGWRGYMIPKLEELLGTNKALLVGGIIWGIWHSPAIAAGHNYGAGYWGEPWSSFALFTLSTIFIGVILTYFTKKTNSVWPAAFLHAINNGGARILGLFHAEEVSGVAANPLIMSAIYAVPVILVAVVCLVRMKKEGLVKLPEKM